MDTILGSLAGAVSAAAYVPLIWQILRGQVRPDRLAWLIWCAEYVVLTAAQYGQGARSSMPVIIAGLLGISLVFVLSLKYGTGSVFSRAGGRHIKDSLLLAGVAAALAGWYLARNPAVAVLLALAVEGTAAALNAAKAYRMPGTESYLYWGMIYAAGLLDLPAARNDGAGIMYAYPAFQVATAIATIMAMQLGVAFFQAGRHSRPQHPVPLQPGSAGDDLSREAGPAAVPVQAGPAVREKAS